MEKALKKLVITREQAEVIEHFKKEHQEKIGDMSLRSFYDALRYGYEVEPEYKKGDYVVYIPEDKICQVEGLVHDGRIYVVSPDVNFTGNADLTNLRHATPSEIAEEKERRFFDWHGREPWKLKLYDTLIGKLDDLPYVVTELHINASSQKTFYELNHGQTYDKEDLRNHFNVLYFVESRLDVKTNE